MNADCECLVLHFSSRGCYRFADMLGFEWSIFEDADAELLATRFLSIVMVVSAEAGRRDGGAANTAVSIARPLMRVFSMISLEDAGLPFLSSFAPRRRRRAIS